MADKAERFLLILIIVVGLITFQWAVIKEFLGISVFYIGYALASFIMSFCILRICSSANKHIAVWLCCINLNNVLDELFFTPTEISYSEGLLVVSASIVSYIIYKKNGRKRNS